MAASPEAPATQGPDPARRIQLIAWAVVLAAFGVFVALLVGLPWLARRYVLTATVAEPALAEPKSGTLAVESRSGILVLREGEGPLEVYEGATISTDSSARGFVRFFDGSTVSLDPNAQVTLERMREPRFAAGDGLRRIDLHVAGPPSAETRLWAGTTWGDLVFTVSTDEYGTVTLAPESHARIDIGAEQLTVQLQDGEATVTSAGVSESLRGDERLYVEVGDAPSSPVKGPQNLVLNADFDEPPMEENGWIFERWPAREQTTSPGTSRHRIEAGDRTVITFDRIGSEGSSADMFYRQFLGDVDVAYSSFIGVTATLRIADQSLPGGGTLYTEFPVIVKLIFEADEDDHEWSVGFYVVPPDLPDTGDYLLTAHHVEVPRDEWYTFESGNLLDETNPFGFAQQDSPLPRPAILKRVEVVASGHDYSSRIDSVRVWVK